MKQTSINSYHEIKEDGTLTKLQDRVLSYVKCSGPVTGREISRMVPGGHKRLSELEALGCVTSHGLVYDLVTRKHVTAWVVTGNEPIKPCAIKTRLKRIAPNILSEIYDKAFEEGARRACEYSIYKQGLAVDKHTIDMAVEEICCKVK